MKIADMEFCEVEKDPTSNIKMGNFQKEGKQIAVLKNSVGTFSWAKKFEAAHKLK